MIKSCAQIRCCCFFVDDIGNKIVGEHTKHRPNCVARPNCCAQVQAHRLLARLKVLFVPTSTK